MVSRRAAENLLDQVQDAVAKGATLHAGGTLADGPGAYFAPAVLTGVTPEMRAYREELFGPVAVVYKVSERRRGGRARQRGRLRPRRRGLVDRRGARNRGRRAARGRHGQRQHARRRGARTCRSAAPSAPASAASSARSASTNSSTSGCSSSTADAGRDRGAERGRHRVDLLGGDDQWWPDFSTSERGPVVPISTPWPAGAVERRRRLGERACRRGRRRSAGRGRGPREQRGSRPWPRAAGPQQLAHAARVRDQVARPR